MGLGKEFKELVLQLYNEKNEEIFSFEYKGDKYWLKKARETKSNLFHKLFYKVTKESVFVPVEQKSPEESVDFETSKIIFFKELGIYSPQVIFKTKNFFVLDDCGIPLYHIFKKEINSQEDFDFYLEKCIKFLANIHLKKAFHGGAQTRNLTIKNDQIYAIDLEDSFANTVSLDVLQFRDFLLFLLSFTKLKKQNFIDYCKIIDLYIRYSENSSIINYLMEFNDKYYFLQKIEDIPLINKFIPRDLKGFLKLQKDLKGYKFEN